MPLVREKVRKRVTRKKESQNEQILLFLFFWLALLVECVGLYARNYTLYTFSRVLILPILFIRVFRSPFYKRVSIYVYSMLLLSLLADLFTIFGSYSFAYIGLSLYTVSYISLGCYFQQIYNNHNKSHIVYIIGSLVQAIFCLFWIYSPELRPKLFILQVGFHSIVLVYVSFWAKTNFNKTPRRMAIIFTAAAIVILLTSIFYGLDLYWFKRKYAFIDALIGLGNGIYLFLITRGALKQVKKI